MADIAKRLSSRWRKAAQGLRGTGSLAALTVLAGCASAAPNPIESPISHKTNILTLTHTVYFGPRSNVPDPDQERGLAHFVTSIGTTKDDDVAVAVARAVSAQARRTAVIEALDRLHVHAVQNADPEDTLAPDTALVRVALPYQAVSRCPDLSQADGIQLAITPRGSFSCVTVSDLEVARNERRRSSSALLAALSIQTGVPSSPSR